MMLLRISLVVAILAGLASFYFTHVNVQNRVTTLTGERDTAQAAQRTAEEAQHKAEKDRRQAREELDKASKELTEKTATLEATASKLAEQEKRANQASEELTKVKGDLNEAQIELSAWKQLGWTPDQIRGFQQQLARVSQE